MGTPPPPAYRADIDGLRAVAVLLVVAFHAYPDRLPGGFIGVDVFFVISGFLITRLLLEARAEQRFSLAAFYAARVRRLFPALVLVLGTTLGIGWLVLLQAEFRQTGLHVAAGAGFASNLLLMTETGYFETAAERKPLLHLWSLGIEEQFYALWPLLLAVAIRYRRVLQVTAGLTAASFLLCLWQAGISPDQAYYSPLARAFALLTGALLAEARHGKGERALHLPPLLGNLASLCGLGLIAASVLLLRKYHVYPGAWTLLPTIGTLLVLVAGPSAWLNRTLLSWRGMVLVGLISYPLYLWHWPLLSFLQIIELRSPSTAMINMALELALVLAILTYWLVERPLRRPEARSTAPLLAAMVVVAGGGLAVGAGLVPARLAPEAPLTPADNWSFPGGDLKGVEMRGHMFHELGQAREKVLVIGDSNAQQYAPRLLELAARHPRQTRTVLFATSTGCAPIPGLQEREGRCHGIVDAALAEALDDPDIVTVVFAADWAAPLGAGSSRFRLESAPGQPSLDQPAARRGALEALEHALRTAVKAGKRTILVLNIPNGHELDPLNSIDRLPGRPAEISQGLSLPEVERRLAGFQPELRKIAARAGAEVIDPLAHLCREGFCPARGPAGEPVYRDMNHLSPAFTRHHVRYLDPVVMRAP